MSVFELNNTTRQINLLDYYDCEVFKSLVMEPRQDEYENFISKFKSDIDGKSEEELLAVKENIEKSLKTVDEVIVSKGYSLTNSDWSDMHYPIFTKNVLRDELEIINELL